MMAATQRQHSEENLRNSIFAIDVSKNSRSVPMRKGTACVVKIEGSTDRVVLVTSRKAVEHDGQLSCARFCPDSRDYEDDYLLKDTLEPRYTQEFCFIPLQKTPKYSLKLVSTNKLRGHGTRLIQSDCLSYTFFGNSFKTLTWEFNAKLNTHELTKVDPKGDLVTSACWGSPVVSTQDEDRSVIGVVDCTSDGDICLKFFGENSFVGLGVGQPVEPALDVTDSPAIQTDCTPVPAQPGQEQFSAEGNNPSRGLGVGQPVEPALDVTDSPAIRTDSTPVPAQPEPQQFSTGGNNPSRDLLGQMFKNLQQIQCDARKINSSTDPFVELEKIASGKGFVISHNEGSGNCMFHALSEQLNLVKGIKISHEELRQTIVQYLLNNPRLPNGTDLFNFIHGYRSWANYLKDMEQDGTWGDHVILYVTANCYKTHIRVISSKSNHYELTITPDGHAMISTNPLVLGHVHEFHYVSLQPKQGLGVRQPVEPALDVTDSPAIRTDSTPPVPAQPGQEQFSAGGNNPSQGLVVGQPVEPALDVTDSPVIRTDSTQVPAQPEQKQFSTGGNNPPRESQFANDNPRNNSESAARRHPEENDTPQGSENHTGASAATQAISQTSIQETDQDREKKWSKERTSKELPCVWHREVQTLKGFEDLLTNILKINLDPKRALGGDYRSLAGAFGKDMKYIWFLETASSPTEELVRKCNPSLKQLIDNLSSKEVDRKDVAKELIAWVEENCTCSCSNCGFSLR